MHLLVAEWWDREPPWQVRDWPRLDVGGQFGDRQVVRVRTDPSEAEVDAVAGLVARGAVVSAAVVAEVPPPEMRWIVVEYRGGLVVGRDLGEREVPGWSAVIRQTTHTVWAPPEATAACELVQEADEFRRRIDAKQPAGVRLAAPELHLGDGELFGDLAGRGSSALLALSGARPGGSEILLRNPAGLELDRTDRLPGTLAWLVATGEVSVRAVGLSAGDDLRDLPGFEDPERAVRVWAGTDRSSRAFWVLAELVAAVDPPVTLPPGHIFEQASVNGVQTLAVSQGSSFVLGPGQSRTVALPAWCLNYELAAPSGQPVTSIPLAARYPSSTSQHDVWSDRARIMAVPSA